MKKTIAETQQLNSEKKKVKRRGASSYRIRLWIALSTAPKPCKNTQKILLSKFVPSYLLSVTN